MSKQCHFSSLLFSWIVEENAFWYETSETLLVSKTWYGRARRMSEERMVKSVSD